MRMGLIQCTSMCQAQNPGKASNEDTDIESHFSMGLDMYIFSSSF